MSEPISGHGGHHMVAAAQAYGVRTLFTLSGAHVFPLYDAAVGGPAGYDAAGRDNAAALAGGPMRVVDTRHEATAVFAAEGTAKLTRTPGFAALTAGPGVTNGVSGLASAYFNGVPMLVVGGRAPAFRWGTGALQEIDHVPLVAPVTKVARTLSDPATIGSDTATLLAEAIAAHPGPVFADVPMDRFYSPAEAPAAHPVHLPRAAADPADIAEIAALLAAAERPVLVLGSDVWMSGADTAARSFAESTGLPVIANGMARGILPRGHDLLVTRARGAAFAGADLVVVAGTPLDFRLGYGKFGEPPAPVVHLTDALDQVSLHALPRATAVGELSNTFESLTRALTTGEQAGGADHGAWAKGLRTQAAAAIAADAGLLASDTDPIHPARIYGELLPRLTDNTIVIGDGGDFVSFAGRFIEPARPGRWLDPGPYGCLGTGLGYALAAGTAFPDDPCVLLLGDGAAGFSLMDVDTLVRHGIPTVMVMGNNGAWGLEKHPMRLLHSYDVAADLQPGLRYDDVVRALGGAGEVVTRPADIGPALDRAFAAGVPYLVNVLTDPEAAYPRSTTGL
ncbi:MAG: acetolactate synthase [Actinobacteria bacterium]|nr:MAG: acetolactate synthase [Actinomycetota bacterium]